MELLPNMLIYRLILSANFIFLYYEGLAQKVAFPTSIGRIEKIYQQLTDFLGKAPRPLFIVRPRRLNSTADGRDVKGITFKRRQ
jgi:hypothetical protein